MPLPPPGAERRPLPPRAAVTTVCHHGGACVPLLWRPALCPGPVSALPWPPPRHTCRSQHKGGDSQPPMVSDRQVIGLQVWGQEHLLCHRLCLLLRGHHRCPTAPLPGCPGSAWDAGLGPPGHLAAGRISSPPPPSPLPGPTGEGTGGLRAHTHSGTPGGFSHLGQGSGALETPHPLCEMEPPATACHVAQHVTALLCCLEQSQAEAELAPDGAGLGLGLDALSQESGPERASHWSKATQPIRDPPGEVLVSEGDVAGSPGASPWPGTSPAGATPELAVNSGTSWRAPTEA